MKCIQCGYNFLDGAPICPGCGLPTSQSQQPQNYGSNPSQPGYYGPPMGPQPSGASYGPGPSQPGVSGAYGPGPSQPGVSGAYGPAAPPPYYGPTPMPSYTPPKKSSNVGLWTCLSIGLLIVIIGACAMAAIGQRYIAHQNDDNATATASSATDDAVSTTTASNEDATSTAYAISLTPTPYPPYSESNPPSQMDFSGTAQSILTNAQIASAVYSDNQPKTISSHFQPDDTVYLTYNLTAGHTGYAMAKWYSQGDDGKESDVQPLDGREGPGYFSATYYGPEQGAVELYWCGKSDCSDRQLAWVRPFTIDPS